MIAQETGFGRFLPTGAGLFAFRTADDVLAAVDALNADYRPARPGGPRDRRGVLRLGQGPAAAAPGGRGGAVSRPADADLRAALGHAAWASTTAGPSRWRGSTAGRRPCRVELRPGRTRRDACRRGDRCGWCSRTSIRTRCSGPAGRCGRRSSTTRGGRSRCTARSSTTGVLGTATFFGAVCDPPAGRHWLFLERVEGKELYQVGDFARLAEAARWLARFHARHAGGAESWPGGSRCCGTTPTSTGCGRSGPGRSSGRGGTRQTAPAVRPAVRAVRPGGGPAGRAARHTGPRRLLPGERPHPPSRPTGCGSARSTGSRRGRGRGWWTSRPSPRASGPRTSGPSWPWPTSTPLRRTTAAGPGRRVPAGPGVLPPPRRRPVARVVRRLVAAAGAGARLVRRGAGDRPTGSGSAGEAGQRRGSGYAPPDRERRRLRAEPGGQRRGGGGPRVRHPHQRQPDGAVAGRCRRPRRTPARTRTWASGCTSTSGSGPTPAARGRPATRSSRWTTRRPWPGSWRRSWPRSSG